MERMNTSNSSNTKYYKKKLVKCKTGQWNFIYLILPDEKGEQ